MIPMPERFPLKVALRRETHEKLRLAQDLLAHVVPSGDIAEVLDRALDTLIRRLEKQKYAVTDRARRSHRGPRTSRGVPAEVRRAVLERDGGRCTFVAENGKRCLSRRRLEFDHIQPVSRGGRSTVANIRLLCRAHNQLVAEQALGREFMNGKIEHARQQRAAAIARKAAEEARALGTQLVSGLRRLGFGADESKRALADFGGSPNATAEVRMKAALAYLVPAQRGQASP
jgi:5-methylcytosine-specific restriction endonuclease McrA